MSMFCYQCEMSQKKGGCGNTGCNSLELCERWKSSRLPKILWFLV